MKQSWVLITSGDENGIGPEVTVKALSFLGPQKNTRFAVFKRDHDKHRVWQNLKKRFRILRTDEINTDLPSISENELLLIESKNPAPVWVEQAARICLSRPFTGICTAPLSKELIRRSGMMDRGHTEILKRVCRKKNLHMGFWGPAFSVVLATDHIPLKEVPRALQKGALKTALSACGEMKRILRRRTMPFFVLGLNPHAGNKGIIGTDESSWIQRELDSFLGSESNPLARVAPIIPADSAFVQEHLKSKPLFLALYHDQGLIPFKMAHGFGAAVHLTLGLDFLRTSVDHGTAFDIFGKNKASPESMIAALEFHFRR
jgi:4-hydroxythreonine-4-phosphate dehydrogenase